MVASAAARISLLFTAIGLLCLLLADMEVITRTPWQELGRFARGFLDPSLEGVAQPGTVLLALARTIAFALLGVALSSIAGLALALVFHHRLVRSCCAILRSVHELFWALIFLQLFGFHPLTGILAIALPYTGIFARVYAEIIEEKQHPAYELLPGGRARLSRYCYSHLPSAWAELRSYTFYRFECGLRASTILGFVGLPTLGYYLHSAFYQGDYPAVASLLLLFFVLIASLRYWLRPRLLPLYVIAAPFLTGSWEALSSGNMQRFLSQDIIPAPLRSGGGMPELFTWSQDLWSEQILPGLINTVVLTQVALLLTGLLSLLLFPLLSRHFLPGWARGLGHGLLVILRSTPEYILAFIFLMLWGPSMLPAIVALGLHNGAIIGHLLGHSSNEIRLRLGHSRGLNLYSYEVVPRLYGQFLAFLFYRWEIIFRESAILGLLGIQTLGFFVISAIEEIRFDRALLLIAFTAGLNVLMDAIARRLRLRLKLDRKIISRQAGVPFEPRQALG